MIRALIARADGCVLVDNKALLMLEGKPDFLEAARQLSVMLGGEVVPLHRDAFYLFPNDAQRQVWVFEGLEPLLRSFSNALPEVIAVNEARGWLMTWSAGETHLIRDGDAQHWKTALHELASLQIATLPALNRLEATGCQILTSLDALLEAWAICATSTSEFAASARKQLEAMPAKLELLEQLGLPLALAHGDFHPMNVISPATIIDWSDALIAHPFTDLERFLCWIMGTNQPHPWTPFADTRALEPEFIAAYLEPWSAFAPLERLIETFHATRPFGLATLLAQHGRLEVQQGTGEPRLKRLLVAMFVRQLAQGRTVIA